MIRIHIAREGSTVDAAALAKAEAAALRVLGRAGIDTETAAAIAYADYTVSKAQPLTSLAGPWHEASLAADDAISAETAAPGRCSVRPGWLLPH